ncbi:MAG: hypothetical protein K2X87_25250, partial [Gemmataceae bacterium]|nr:hypothetical protein [Gemmataceae bacterium]
MNPRPGLGTGSVPAWKLRRWLPAVLAAGLGGGALAQPPKSDPPAKAEQPKADDEKRIGVSFTQAQWEDVLDWYGKESGLILVTTVKPTGSVTIKPQPPGRKFTLAEVTDLLNEAMIKDKFLLIRYQTTFTIWPAEIPLDPTRIPRVDAAELAKRGKTEIVRCTVGPLKNLNAAEVFPEVEKMLTPQYGKAILLERMNSIQVSDTAGNILSIKKTLEDDITPSDTLTHVCKYRAAGDVAAKLKELLTDKETTVGGSAAATPAPGGGNPGGFGPGGGPQFFPGGQPGGG